MKRDRFESRQSSVEAALQLQLERATTADAFAASPADAALIPELAERGQEALKEHADPEIAELKEGWQTLCSALRAQDLALTGSVSENPRAGARQAQRSPVRAEVRTTSASDLKQRVRERTRGRTSAPAGRRPWLIALVVIPAIAGGAWGLSSLAVRRNTPIAGNPETAVKPSAPSASVPVVEVQPKPAWQISPDSGGTPQPVVETAADLGGHEDFAAWDDLDEVALEDEIVAVQWGVQHIEHEWRFSPDFLQWIALQLQDLREELALTQL